MHIGRHRRVRTCTAIRNAKHTYVMVDVHDTDSGDTIAGNEKERRVFMDVDSTELPLSS